MALGFGPCTGHRTSRRGSRSAQTSQSRCRRASARAQRCRCRWRASWRGTRPYTARTAAGPAVHRCSLLHQVTVHSNFKNHAVTKHGVNRRSLGRRCRQVVGAVGRVEARGRVQRQLRDGEHVAKGKGRAVRWLRNPDAHAVHAGECAEVTVARVACGEVRGVALAPAGAAALARRLYRKQPYKMQHFRGMCWSLLVCRHTPGNTNVTSATCSAVRALSVKGVICDSVTVNSIWR